MTINVICHRAFYFVAIDFVEMRFIASKKLVTDY